MPEVAAEPERTAVARFLDVVSVAPRQTSGRLTLWPLVLRSEPAPRVSPRYVALEDAVASGAASVTELTKDGAESLLRIENQGELPVLGLFGEELRGGLRDRCVQRSFLAPPGGALDFEVRGVEEKRWARRLAERVAHRESPGRFEVGRELVAFGLRRRISQPPAPRAKRSRVVQTGVEDAALSAELRARLIRAGARSRTLCHADYAAAHAPGLAELCSAFHAVPDQVGFLSGLDGVVIAVELIGRPEVFVRVFERMLRSYALDALGAPPAPGGRSLGAPRFATPAALLKALAGARVGCAPARGLGCDLRLDGPGLAGAALAARQLVHLCAFVA